MKKWLVGIFLICASWAAFGEGAFPSKPLKIVVGFAAGAPTDILARALAQWLSKELGQPVITENRPGAGGTIGAVYAAKAAPDGYTLYIGDMSHAVAASLYRNLPYDPVHDYAGISRISQFRMALLVGPKVTAPDLKSFVADLKAHPNKYSHGSSGNGSAIHLFNQMFTTEVGAQAVHVPFHGGGEIVQGLLSGTVDFAFFTTQGVAAYLKSGQIRCLGVAGSAREASAPQIPTFKEQGYTGLEFFVWNAIYAPKGTPQDILQKLNRATSAVLDSPEFAAKAKALGAEVATERTTTGADAILRSEVEKWAPVVKANGLQAG
jgi:tripartite-type tricarboxylate transporter receptor subunit TctC